MFLIMRQEKDFKEFIELLNENKVKYLIRNKKASARPQDIADLKLLEKFDKKK